MNWVVKNNILYKEAGEIHYQILCKLPLEDWLEPTWFAYRCEGGLVMIELTSGKLENCLKACNSDAKILREDKVL